MPNPHALSAEQREFCRLIHETVFSNPFGDKHLELVRQFTGVSEARSPQDLMARAFAKAREKVHELESQGLADITLVHARDRRLVQSLLLYDTYGRFIKDFDQLIERQSAAGDAPCPVPFAGEALALLTRRGFAEAEALRFFAFYYQLRRAFFFIREGLVGQAPSTRELRCHLWDNVFTFAPGWYEDYLWNRMEDFSTLLLGETGTGKGAAAAAIGRSGYIPFDVDKGCFVESFTRNFIDLNLSQFPETLIESELFGHKKGAFTGAISDRLGAFARCTPHGAILLDEIGDVPATVQVKLLQVLQERTFLPVGGSQKQRFRGRVIAATNKPLAALRGEGGFRDDFFYRLCTDIVTVPPLRERLREEPRELEILLAQVIERILGETSPELANAVGEILASELGPDYPWPGNVRELEQAVRRILLTGRYGRETRSRSGDLRERLHQDIDLGSLDAQELLAAYCALLYARLGNYQEVARTTRLDHRTVKKYIQLQNDGSG